ncbi:hypothetical protein E2562_015938 [Oryza meyeriana var. granulata]|uniref:Uncharacterized protein n=1 Tax=Oryza meyeriana var. granulata TaxID=110450 RepID=A0A6G1CGI6_9ORYZ|nr:hypothetical protein E2562_015938 [Oryza meyeriana var. granulata]
MGYVKAITSTLKMWRARGKKRCPSLEFMARSRGLDGTAQLLISDALPWNSLVKGVVILMACSPQGRWTDGVYKKLGLAWGYSVLAH